MLPPLLPLLEVASIWPVLIVPFTLVILIFAPSAFDAPVLFEPIISRLMLRFACNVIEPGLPGESLFAVLICTPFFGKIIEPCSLMMLTLPLLPVGISLGAPPAKLSMQLPEEVQSKVISFFALRVMSPAPLGAKNYTARPTCIFSS
jgi:hypothetical protein